MAGWGFAHHAARFAALANKLWGRLFRGLEEVGGLWGCVCRMGCQSCVSGSCAGRCSWTFPQLWVGSGLVRPNVGVVGGESCCFLMVLRVILTTPGEDKHYDRYKIIALAKRHNSPVVHTMERNWEFLDQFLTLPQTLQCYFRAVTKSLRPPSVKQPGLEQFVSLEASI